MKGFLFVLLVGFVFSEESEQHMPGGVEADTMKDPIAQNAFNHFFIDFVKQATSHDCFDIESERIVIGDIEKVTKQVVSGERFVFKLKTVITDQCPEAAPHALIAASDGDNHFNHFFVSEKECNLGDDVELLPHTITVTWQPWKEGGYNYIKMDDKELGDLLAGCHKRRI